jgi:hypothetical protein
MRKPKFSAKERLLIKLTITSLQQSAYVPRDARTIAANVLAELLSPTSKRGRRRQFDEAKASDDAERFFEVQRARSDSNLSYKDAVAQVAKKASVSEMAIEKSIADFKKLADWRHKVTPQQYRDFYHASGMFEKKPSECYVEDNVRMAAFEAVIFVSSQKKSISERAKTSGDDEFMRMYARCVEHATVHLLERAFPPTARERLRDDARAMAIHYALSHWPK